MNRKCCSWGHLISYFCFNKVHYYVNLSKIFGFMWLYLKVILICLFYTRTCLKTVSRKQLRVIIFNKCYNLLPYSDKFPGLFAVYVCSHNKIRYNPESSLDARNTVLALVRLKDQTASWPVSSVENCPLSLVC